MSILNAKKFILKCKYDSLFRKQLYKCTSKQEVLCTAKKKGIDFTNPEAMHAFTELKAVAQNEDDLDEIAELKMWYEMQTGGEESDPLSICYACSVHDTCTNYRKLLSGKTPEEIKQEEPKL
jgi:predicted ribosomally synthesized peptide with nif11-like leader